MLPKFLFALTIIINLFALSNVSFSQGRRDWDPTEYPRYNPGDTTKISYGDTTAVAIDSTKILEIDTTATERYLAYDPDYLYGVAVTPKKHPLLLDDASQIEYKVSFDTTGKVIISKTFMGEDIKVPRIISFDDYLQELAAVRQDKIFNNIVEENFTNQTQDELSEIFEKFTDITIPLPFKTETIFGPPTINLRINGAIDITASYENIESEQLITSNNTSSQNNINFKQEVLVTAKGTIGDKLTIDADWNTQRVFDFENQLKIKYEGYPDEVIKKIEAGNVSLETNSGLIQSTQALFGIKGEFQLGPLSLTTVVSQKKSKQEEKDYTGGTQEQDFRLSAYEYSDNHFFLDTLYKKSFVDYYNSASLTYDDSTIAFKVEKDRTSFEVWVQTDVTEVNKRFAVATTMLYEEPQAGYSDSLKSTEQIPGLRFAGNFRKLDQTEYYINEFAGFISLKIPVPAEYHIGITYETQNGRKYGTPGTEVNSDSIMILKMVKTKDQSPDQTPVAWELKLKNIYRLPVSKVVENGFSLSVQYLDNNVLVPSLPGISTSLSTMLGVDRYTGKERTGGPDDIFDYFPGYTINPETGDIIFPTLRPFLDNLDTTINGVTVDSSLIYDEIYTQRKSVASISPLASKYYIIGKAKGEAGVGQNTINLGFNIVQGSVKLFLGSQELVKDIDYSVDYSTGVVVIKNAAALISNDLKIKYEVNDLFQLASKTLIGARGVYKFNEESSLGFTFVNLRQETLNDKVRIGEEPTNNSMFGVDFTTQIKSGFLTRLVNFLPGYNTKEESAFTFRGEFAYLTPDPNTKRSNIPSDNNESIAYVDDMEGAKKIVSLGTNYSTWHMGSVPKDSNVRTVVIDTSSIQTDSLANLKRARLRWYNVPNDVDVKDVFPLRDVQAGQDRLTPFYLAYDPTSRGIFNYNAEYSQIPNKKDTWNGIMKYLNTTSTDLVNENINFIEFNMRIDSTNAAALQDGRLIIELGTISEDAIPNGKLDTEDKNNNGVLEESEDIGLDYMVDSEELDKWRSDNNDPNAQLSDFPNNDPAQDNNDLSGAINYDVINGTQNNRFFEGGNRPDTEDLDRNGTLDNANSYFQYEISLDTTNNTNISGQGAVGSGWFQYRISLSEFVTKVGNITSLTNVEYARVWIRGIDQPIRIALVDFNLVGNQWYKPDKQDTSYNVSVVSIEENPQIYESPVPGNVLRQQVNNTTGGTTLSNEQSLSLGVTNLLSGQRKIVVKDYKTNPIDIFNYKTMKLFVNGDPSFSYVDETRFDAWMVVRFGADSNNYYEYKAPIHPDVRPGSPWNAENEVTINFADLTALKITQDSAGQVVEIPVPNGPPGAVYVVKGSPALNSIREIVLGVEKNRNSFNNTITGSVWFDEVRLLNVDDDNGFAYNFTTGVNLADFMNLNFSLSKVSPNFYNLDGRFGSRQTGLNWDMGGTINMHKLINNALASWISEDWGNFLNLPLTFRHTENLVKPEYYPGTDIEIEKAAQERYADVLNETGSTQEALTASENLKLEAQTLEVSNSFGVSGMTFTFPGSNYFVTNIINKLAFNFNTSFGNYRNVTYENKDNVGYNGSVEFNPDFDLADKFHLNIGSILNLGDEYKEGKLYFTLPFIPLAPLFSNNFKAGTDFNRTREEKRQRSLNIDDPTSRVFNANRGFSFDWKFIENWVVDLTGSYNFRVGSDLTPFEYFNDSLRTQRPESQILDEIFFNDGIINFGRDLDYSQSTSFNPKFNIPGLKKFLDFTVGYNVTYGWQNPSSSENNTGFNVGFSNTVNSTANLKLNEVFGLFKGGDEESKSRGTLSGRNDDREGQNIGDILKLFTSFVPENISVTYSQSNSRVNPAITGIPGFSNFWMNPTTNEDLGPSRMYQLGFDTDPGSRVPNLTNITDSYNESNNVTFSTTIKPLIPEAIRMNLTFKTRWGFANTNTYNTNDQGVLAIQTNKSTNVNNAYSIFFVPDIENFRYQATTNPDENLQNITDAFKSNVSTFPFPNWNLTISGVEKFPFFGQFASAVSIENNFESEFATSFAVDRSNIEVPAAQIVKQSFNPLFGMNFTFKEAFGGSLTASLKFNKSKVYTLVPSSNLIQTSNNSDWSLNASFSKAGFEIPFFGLSLKNDIAFSLTVSNNSNEPTDYRFSTASPTPDPLPGNGSKVFTVNPSIQYSLSSKVQMQLFYKYIKTEPINNVTTIPRTSNEGGLNIRITIQ